MIIEIIKTFIADYLWHNDEIPYNSKAKCYRGHSYYSNSLTANDTDIDIASDIDSLLGYDNDYACYYCVCSVDGTAAGCIHRDVQFCNFFKVIREEKAQRDRYTTLLEQDRPTYFRQLSWRMRRTMDAGMFDLIKSGMTLSKCLFFFVFGFFLVLDSCFSYCDVKCDIDYVLFVSTFLSDVICVWCLLIS